MNGIVSNFSLADYVGAEVPPLATNIYRHESDPDRQRQRPTLPDRRSQIAVARCHIVVDLVYSIHFH